MFKLLKFSYLEEMNLISLLERVIKTKLLNQSADTNISPQFVLRNSFVGETYNIFN